MSEDKEVGWAVLGAIGIATVFVMLFATGQACYYEGRVREFNDYREHIIQHEHHVLENNLEGEQ
jgi:hypothetical protein